jgi:hypothetical protein
VEETGVREVLEMGVTRAEFVRLLPAAIGQDEVALTDDAVSGHWEGMHWRLTIAEKPPRRIARLSVPVLEVILEFPGAARAQARPFVERFLRAYQRAGG